MSDQKPPRLPDGKFQKGVSGNPKGFNGEMRGRLYEVSQLAQQYTTKAIKGLVAIAEDDEAPAIARVSAWNSILDRAYGKPAQAVDLSNSDGSLTDLFAAAVMLANGINEEAFVETDGSSATH